MDKRHHDARPRTVTLIVCAIPVLTLLLAGILKVLNPEQFRSTLQNWKIIPSMLVSPLLLFVIFAEVALPLIWLLGIFRCLISTAILVLITSYTVAFIAEYAQMGGASCNCFVLSNQDRDGTSIIWLITRNTLLSALLLPVYLQKKQLHHPSP